MIPVVPADEPSSFDAHVRRRGEFITDYRSGRIDLDNVERYAPFVASELRRQGRLRGEDA